MGAFMCNLNYNGINITITAISARGICLNHAKYMMQYYNDIFQILASWNKFGIIRLYIWRLASASWIA